MQLWLHKENKQKNIKLKYERISYIQGNRDNYGGIQNSTPNENNQSLSWT